MTSVELWERRNALKFDRPFFQIVKRVTEAFGSNRGYVDRIGSAFSSNVAISTAGKTSGGAENCEKGVAIIINFADIIYIDFVGFLDSQLG